MKLKLQILIMTIVVLAVHVPAVRAQANLTFSGGSGTPLTITLRNTVSYTFTAPCRNAFPVFKTVGVSFPFMPVTGTMRYRIVNGASNSITVASGNSMFGDVAPNDVIVNYTTNNTFPTLPTGTVFQLVAGAVTTNANVAAPPPANGNFTTFLICSETGNFRTSGNGTLLPTAAAVSVSGRVLTNTKRGVMNASVRLTDAAGNTRTARTNPFGYYRFENIPTGQTVTITVVSKRYQFAAQVVNIAEENAGMDFVALSPAP